MNLLTLLVYSWNGLHKSILTMSKFQIYISKAIQINCQFVQLCSFMKLLSLVDKCRVHSRMT